MPTKWAIYKIVASIIGSLNDPDTYVGGFDLTNDVPILQALAREFGSGSGTAVEKLNDWSGGESACWDANLRLNPTDSSEFEVDNVHISVSVRIIGN